MSIAPDSADVSILAEAVAAHVRDDSAALINIGVVLPSLSQAAREWFIFGAPDKILRGALNCFWATGDARLRDQRRRAAMAVYHGCGAAIRARIIAVQDAIRAELRAIMRNEMQADPPAKP